MKGIACLPSNPIAILRYVVTVFMVTLISLFGLVVLPRPASAISLVVDDLGGVDRHKSG